MSDPDRRGDGGLGADAPGSVRRTEAAPQPDHDAPLSDQPGTEDMDAALAAIRELVSAEARARSAHADRDLLVLTPAMRWAPRPDAAGRDSGAGSGAGAAPAEAELLRPLGPPILDEEALRSLVAEMVRDELNGAIGTAMRHDLRRLVRREIARTLAAAGRAAIPGEEDADGPTGRRT